MLADQANVRVLLGEVTDVDPDEANVTLDDGTTLNIGAGAVLAKGPLTETLTADAISECFGLRLRLERRDDRWTAWAPRR